jgi:hypothetical protein
MESNLLQWVLAFMFLQVKPLGAGGDSAALQRIKRVLAAERQRLNLDASV